jgi:UDP-glucose 4-epimerase
MSLNIGITGASGFLGSYLLRFLQQREGYRLRALTRSANSENIYNSSFLSAENKMTPQKAWGHAIQWQQGDLASRADCEEFLTGLDVVIHLAHTNTGLSSNRDLPADASANLIPTLNLIQAIAETRRNIHVVYASSGGAVYGESRTMVPFTESDICAPISSYGIQKLSVEHYLRMTSQNGDLSACILRISNPYGVLLPIHRMQGFIGVALQRIKMKQPIKLFVDPQSVRDYLHIHDMCRAFEAAMKPQSPKNNSHFSLYNIGSGRGLSLLQVIKMLETHIGSFEVISESKTTPAPATLPSWNVLNITQARQKLEWEPEIAFENGLALLCKESFS